MKKMGEALLIDDSIAVNKRNESILKSMGIFEKIHFYSKPLEALGYLEKAKTLPNFIFLDLNMPGMNGFEFLNTYKNIKTVCASNYQPKIIIVSDHLLEDRNLDNTNNYKSIGVIDHLRKPFDKEDILELLEEHIDNFNS